MSSSFSEGSARPPGGREAPARGGRSGAARASTGQHLSNIDTANVYFGLVLERLVDSFPASIHLSGQEVWQDFTRIASNGQLSLLVNRHFRTLSMEEASNDGNVQKVYSKQMLAWMKAEGYIICVNKYPYDYVLSTKSLALLNLGIGEERETFGSQLKSSIRSAGDKATGEVISELVGQAMEALQGWIM